MRYLFLILLVVFVGCNKQLKVDDPCKITICWGEKGVQPQDVPLCRQVAECHNWIMGSR